MGSQKIRSGSEARDMGKKGGIASGEARRRKRDLRFALCALMDGVDEETGESGTEKLACALWKRALSGDLKSIELVVSWVQAANMKQENEELGIEF